MLVEVHIVSRSLEMAPRRETRRDEEMRRGRKKGASLSGFQGSQERRRDALIPRQSSPSFQGKNRTTFERQRGSDDEGGEA